MTWVVHNREKSWPGGIISFGKWEKGNIKRENDKHRQVPRQITFRKEYM